MNASIAEDGGTKVNKAQVCTDCEIKTFGMRHSAGGHGGGSKPGKAPGELREPMKVTPPASASKGGLTFKKVDQST